VHALFPENVTTCNDSSSRTQYVITGTNYETRYSAFH